MIQLLIGLYNILLTSNHRNSFSMLLVGVSGRIVSLALILKDFLQIKINEPNLAESKHTVIHLYLAIVLIWCYLRYKLTIIKDCDK